MNWFEEKIKTFQHSNTLLPLAVVLVEIDVDDVVVVVVVVVVEAFTDVVIDDEEVGVDVNLVVFVIVEDDIEDVVVVDVKMVEFKTVVLVVALDEGVVLFPCCSLKYLSPYNSVLELEILVKLFLQNLQYFMHPSATARR